MKLQPIYDLGHIPHMHLLGTGYQLNVFEGFWEEEYVQSDNYDLNNQLTYQIQSTKCMKVMKYILSAPDNSETIQMHTGTPQDVTYGERTDQEMCYAFTLLSVGH